MKISINEKTVFDKEIVRILNVEKLVFIGYIIKKFSSINI